MIYEREVYLGQEELDNKEYFPEYLIIRLKKKADQGQNVATF